MKFSVKTYAKPYERGPGTRISVRRDLLYALELGAGESVEAVVERGVLILCRLKWVEVFEEILRDFPGAFISEAEAAPKSVSAPGATRIENGLQER